MYLALLGTYDWKLGKSFPCSSLLTANACQNGLFPVLVPLIFNFQFIMCPYSKRDGDVLALRQELEDLRVSLKVGYLRQWNKEKHV